jgi:pimeloyl-ACP methyl ester carboxylesterase
MALAQRLALHYIRTKFRLLSAISPAKAAQKAFVLFCTPQYRNKKKLPPIFEKAEQLSFKFLSYTIRGYRWNGGAGKKVLILHGFESSVVNFDRYVKPLIKNGYEVLAFDAPAHGRSSGKTINAVIYKDFIAYLYQHYGPMDAYMAHSFGGLAVSLFLAETKHSAETKAVLIAPAAETTTAAHHFFKLLQLGEATRKAFDQVILEKGGHHMEWFSIRRALKQIKAQVLFLQDKDDALTPYKDVAPIMEMNLPNVSFVISEGLGHRRIYRDNQTMKRIIEFL